MNEEKTKQLEQELCLALIYLTGWREGPKEDTMIRAWKGYDFALLDTLKEDGLLDFSYKAKSLYLTEDGEEKALEILKGLQERYFKS